MIVIPTGGGKTIVFSTVIKGVCEQYPGTRILILAHTKELVQQAEEKLVSVWDEAPVGVFAAGLGRKEVRQIISASRDSIVHAMDKIGVIDLVFIDEAHLLSEKAEGRYRQIISALLERNPNLSVVGFTATPYRVDTGLIYGDDDRHLFKGLAYEAKIKDLIADGYLCPIVSQPVESEAIADLADVKTVNGDFSNKQLSEAVIKGELVKRAVGDWYSQAHLKGRKSTVFFAVSIAHAEQITLELFHLGIEARLVSGTTPDAEREETLRRFDAGELPCIVNVAVLTTGWDCPRLDCIALMRPTKSLGLFMQMVGRGLRLHDSKTDTLLLDFGECLQRFGPIDIAQPPERRQTTDRVKPCPHCNKLVGIFKRKCPHCEAQLQTPPFKLCPECGEENSPSAAKCCACGHTFANHQSRASKDKVFSMDAPDIRTFPVLGISVQAMESSQSGRPYLKVLYQRDQFNYYSRNIMIGYPGMTGEVAKQEWLEMCVPGTSIPSDPASACRMATSSPIFRAVKSMQVNLTSKWKTVESLTYSD